MSGSRTGFCGTVIWKVTTLLAFPPDPVGAADCESLMATPQPNVGRCLPQRWSFGNFFLPGPEPVPPHILACRSPRVVRPERVHPVPVPGCGIYSLRREPQGRAGRQRA